MARSTSISGRRMLQGARLHLPFDGKLESITSSAVINWINGDDLQPGVLAVINAHFARVIPFKHSLSSVELNKPNTKLVMFSEAASKSAAPCADVRNDDATAVEQANSVSVAEDDCCATDSADDMGTSSNSEELSSVTSALSSLASCAAGDAVTSPEPEKAAGVDRSLIPVELHAHTAYVDSLRPAHGLFGAQRLHSDFFRDRQLHHLRNGLAPLHAHFTTVVPATRVVGFELPAVPVQQ